MNAGFFFSIFSHIDICKVRSDWCDARLPGSFFYPHQGTGHANKGDNGAQTRICGVAQGAGLQGGYAEAWPCILMEVFETNEVEVCLLQRSMRHLLAFNGGQVRLFYIFVLYFYVNTRGIANCTRIW